MSEELNNHRPYTAAELSNLLHNERAERAEEINALAVVIGLERVREAGSILAAVEKLAADALSRPAPAVQVPDAVAAFDEGFRRCADWACRSDLLADMDSPAYQNDRHQSLGLLGIAAEKGEKE